VRLILPGRAIPTIMPMQARGRSPRGPLAKLAASRRRHHQQATASLACDEAALAREHLCFELAALGSLIGTRRWRTWQLSTNCRVCNIKAGVRLLRRSEHRDTQDSNRIGRRGDCHGRLLDAERLGHSLAAALAAAALLARSSPAGPLVGPRSHAPAASRSPSLAFRGNRFAYRHPGGRLASITAPSGIGLPSLIPPSGIDLPSVDLPSIARSSEGTGSRLRVRLLRLGAPAVCALRGDGV
jgi:hypothetical protein